MKKDEWINFFTAFTDDVGGVALAGLAKIVHEMLGDTEHPTLKQEKALHRLAAALIEADEAREQLDQLRPKAATRKGAK